MAICLDYLDQWLEAFPTTTEQWQSDETFATCFYHSMTPRPELLQLISRLDLVIEHNIPIPVFVEAKRHMARVFSDFRDAMGEPLKLSDIQTQDVIRSLGSLLMGAVQGDLGPKFENSELPDDVRRLMDLFSSEQLFVTNACRIIRCIRLEHD